MDEPLDAFALSFVFLNYNNIISRYIDKSKGLFQTNHVI